MSAGRAGGPFETEREARAAALVDSIPDGSGHGLTRPTPTRIP
jgi:hypothetical protein